MDFSVYKFGILTAKVKWIFILFSLPLTPNESSTYIFNHSHMNAAFQTKATPYISVYFLPLLLLSFAIFIFANRYSITKLIWLLLLWNKGMCVWYCDTCNAKIDFILLNVMNLVKISATFHLLTHTHSEHLSSVRRSNYVRVNHHCHHKIRTFFKSIFNAQKLFILDDISSSL